MLSLPVELRDLLCAAGLLKAAPAAGIAADPLVERLSGGVSSDVLVVHTTPTPVLAKRALPQLRVAGLWEAPVERSSSEARWLAAAGELVPGLAPQLLAQGEGWLVMPYLPSTQWTTWKTMLLAGRGADPALVARRLGTALGQLHERAAARPELAERFETTDAFTSLRLTPYLRTLATSYPQLTDAQRRIEASLLANRRTLVHGDVSPKNVLVDGADGTPVLIDAECAWWGDAAFDLAFCLNHLLLKQLVVAEVAPVQRAARVLATSYLDVVAFEAPQAIAARAARLLPWLLLARVDGLSPVEYLDEERAQRVRRAALTLLHEDGKNRGGADRGSADRGGAGRSAADRDLDSLLSVVEGYLDV